MKKIYLFVISQLISLCCYAETWDEVVNSGNYYYGIGKAATQEEAYNMAWTEMLNSIVVHVSSDFEMISEENTINGQTDSRQKVMDCMKTYSQGTFTNVGSMTRGKAPHIEVLR